MKRFLIGLALLAPAILLLFLSLQSQADLTASLPLFHFYIGTFTTFTAVVLSILLTTSLEGIAHPRHVLAAVAFAVIGSTFFLHGLLTPGALIDHLHPAVIWSSWLALLGGGLIFALASLDGPAGVPSWLPVRQVAYLSAGGVGLYLAIAILAPDWLSFIDSYAVSWHKTFIFLTSLGLWLWAAFRLGRTWWITRSRVDGTLAFVAFWLAQAVLSMHQFTTWQLSWWLYHFLLSLGFLFTVYVLVAEYEQTRQFQLWRYYLAASLILTVLLALVTSYLFAQFSYQTLVNQLKASSANLARHLTQEIANSLPANNTMAASQNIYAARLKDLPLGEVTLYDPAGLVFYPAGSNDRLAPWEQPEFERALAGETTVEIYAPAETAAYTPFGSVYTIQTYTPLLAGPGSTVSASPIGVLVIQQAVPELSQAILQARTTGLIISAATMGLLFVALLLVVTRADRIIATRTQELFQAYTSLRQAESMRDDLSHMIVHDLRNPLNVISATLDLLLHTNGEVRIQAMDRFLVNAHQATRRMTGLIDDILTVGKIEAGQFTPQFVPTSLSQLLSDHLNSFILQAALENKQFSIDCPPDLTAQLDPALIGRVIENLVSNAFKYTDPEGIIQVSAQAEQGGIRLCIRDNGEGIPDSYKRQIFDKFAQAPNANGHPRRKGTGLGLTFCGLAVRAHGGEIWVADAPNGGSDFIFLLPQPPSVPKSHL